MNIKTETHKKWNDRLLNEFSGSPSQRSALMLAYDLVKRQNRSTEQALDMASDRFSSGITLDMHRTIRVMLSRTSKDTANEIRKELGVSV